MRVLTLCETFIGLLQRIGADQFAKERAWLLPAVLACIGVAIGMAGFRLFRLWSSLGGFALATAGAMQLLAPIASPLTVATAATLAGLLGAGLACYHTRTSAVVLAVAVGGLLAWLYYPQALWFCLAVPFTAGVCTRAYNELLIIVSTTLAGSLFWAQGWSCYLPLQALGAWPSVVAFFALALFIQYTTNQGLLKSKVSRAYGTMSQVG